MFLDTKCREQNLNIRATDDELLGQEWWLDYKNFTPTYTNEVIDKLKMALGMPIEKYNPRKRYRR